MTQPDPLDALWQADEPPARDYAFTAAVIARPPAARPGIQLARRLLTGLGVAGAAAGAVLMVNDAGLEPWSLALVGAAMVGALWTAGRLTAAG